MYSGVSLNHICLYSDTDFFPYSLHCAASFCLAFAVCFFKSSCFVKFCCSCCDRHHSLPELGFLSQRNTCFLIREIHMTISEKYSLQDLRNVSG